MNMDDIEPAGRRTDLRGRQDSHPKPLAGIWVQSPRLAGFRGGLGICLTLPLLAAGTARADFTAFNDHVPGAGTSPNATSYRVDQTASGRLREITTGEDLDVTLTVSGSGYNMEGTSGEPPAGSDAAGVFNGFVDFGSGSGSSIALTGEGQYTHTFSGLAAGEVYEFAGTTVRGNSGYTDRWTLVTLEGAEAFTPDHTEAIGVVTDGLAANQVAFWSGANQAAGQGWVVRWKGIDPGVDGTFSVVSSRYTGPTPGVGSGTATGSKAYGLHGIRLRGTIVAGLPVVANVPAREVKETRAELGGEVLEIGDSVPDVVLYYGADDGGADPAAWDHAVALGGQSGAFFTLVDNLIPGRIYHHTFRATNSRGTRWALPSLSFTAAALPPEIAVAPATAIGFTSADLHGEVTATGGEIPQVTVCYGTADAGTDLAAWGSVEPIGPHDGLFDLTAENLQPNTVYFYRVLAQNSAGAVWSAGAATFTTLLLELPGVVNRPAGNVGAVAAVLNGTVTVTGGESPLVVIFYGSTDGGTVEAQWQHRIDLDVQSGDFSAVATGLEPSTTYHFTARVSNTLGSVWAPASLSFRTAELSDVLITEFMAANDRTPIPGTAAGTYVDWIELHNRGDEAVNLGGWHLTDKPGNPDKWAFPPGTILGAGGYLVVLATGEGKPDALGNLQTNFTLSKSGDYLALVRPDLTLAQEFAPGGADFPSQDDDISYGLAGADLAVVYFDEPTPGEANPADGFSRVRDTKFSHNRGYYTQPFEVTITTATGGATIRYTLDGSEPTEAGAGAQTYNGPVPIGTTTVLRARAFKNGYRPTNTDTQTYLFAEDIAGQTRPSGYPGSWGAEPNADYDVDRQITENALYRERFLEGLLDLPTLSVAGNVNDLFGPSGLYSNPEDRNMIRAVSAEYFRPARGGEGVLDEAGFTVEAGLKIQGGASRLPSKAIKHSLSLRFRSAYGVDTLKYPLFDGSRVEEFNSIHLRAMYNNSWIHWDSGQRKRGTLLRDQWMRDSFIAMGNADGGRGSYVHLFLNGLYWGVYNLHERLENSHYANWNGGDEDEILAYNPIDPEPAQFTALRTLVAGGNWAQIQQAMAVDNFIDWYLMQHFGHNDDLKNNGNWRVAGAGPSGLPWRFYLWDSERVLETASNTGPLASAQEPAGLLDSLDNLEEFRVRFADRVQKHLFNGGALTPENCLARWQARVAAIDRAIVCESARWGDNRPDGQWLGNFTRDIEWITEVTRIAGQWFPLSEPNRTSTMIAKFLRESWPGRSEPKLLAVPAPVFQVGGRVQHGGRLAPGETWFAIADSGDVWYTLDGSDPRLEGGAINPSARQLTSGATLEVSGLIRARAREGTSWSPLVEADFMVHPGPQPGDLLITEVNYHPVNPSMEEATRAALLTPALELNDEDFEFLEVHNVTDQWLNLAGLRFSAGLDFAFPNLDLPPGGYAVIGRRATALKLRYGDALEVAGEWWGALDNGGETLTLLNDVGAVLTTFKFKTGGRWPGRADGAGSSLEWADTGLSADDPRAWRASSEYGGSPGRPGLGPDRRIRINEVLTHTDPPITDAIELLNPGEATIDLSGWLLSDSSARLAKFRIPSDTTLLPGAFLVFDESDFNPAVGHAIQNYGGGDTLVVTSAAHGLETGDTITILGYGGHPAYNATWPITRVDADRFTVPVRYLDNHPTKGSWVPGEPFALSSWGEDVWLVETDGEGYPSRFVDHREFGAAENGRSFGVFLTADGEEHFTALEQRTLGGPNAAPLISPVVISEILYHPASGDAEFIELHNRAEEGAALFDSAHPANTWRLEGAGFSFPPGITLAAGETVVVCAGDPVGFAQTAGVPAGVRVFGPTGAPLDNSGERLSLQRPDTPDGDAVPYLTVDSVRYEPYLPWPMEANGGGPSLERSELAGFPDTALNWRASTADGGTPGRVPGEGETHPIPRSWLEQYYTGVDLDNPEVTGPDADSDADGLRTFVEYAFASRPTVASREDLPAAAVEWVEVGGTREAFLTLTFRRRTDDAGLGYGVEATGSLAVPTAWEDASAAFVEELLVDHGDGTATVRWREGVPFDRGPGERYLRFIVFRP